jgi:hypothetical protein
MLKLDLKYVVDSRKRRRAVQVPLAQWSRILEELEELEAIRDYDRAKAESQESIPFEQAMGELEEG